MTIYVVEMNEWGAGNLLTFVSFCDKIKKHGGAGYLRCGLHAFFYKNNFTRTTRLKFGKKIKTIQAGIWNHKCKFTFFNKILLFSSNLTVSSVEILQMLRRIEFP